jgi:hypothetical protein
LASFNIPQYLDKKFHYVGLFLCFWMRYLYITFGCFL